MTAARKSPPPLIVIHGEDDLQKTRALADVLDTLLPPEVDRSLALTTYDGTRPDDQGGPTPAAVFEDLATLPFLADRRVVIIRDADGFIRSYREKLENYVAKPSPTAVLVLECRSFPVHTRLAKGAKAVGGQVVSCAKLKGRDVHDFVVTEARRHDKRINADAARRLVDLVGPEAGALASEVEKLALYVGDRPTIDGQAVETLVGQSREEKIFAVMDAAALGRLPDALRLWHQTLTTDPDAPFRALGGVAYVLRRWLSAHQLHTEGLPLSAIAPKVMMWRRERELQQILDRLPPARLRRALAGIARLDAQAKSGTRSIETGVEHLLSQLAARPA
jgi:DNA polymerase-3 subunit delta